MMCFLKIKRYLYSTSKQRLFSQDPNSIIVNGDLWFKRWYSSSEEQFRQMSQVIMVARKWNITIDSCFCHGLMESHCPLSSPAPSVSWWYKAFSIHIKHDYITPNVKLNMIQPFRSHRRLQIEVVNGNSTLVKRTITSNNFHTSP